MPYQPCPLFASRCCLTCAAQGLGQVCPAWLPLAAPDLPFNVSTPCCPTACCTAYGLWSPCCALQTARLPAHACPVSAFERPLTGQVISWSPTHSTSDGGACTCLPCRGCQPGHLTGAAPHAPLQVWLQAGHQQQTDDEQSVFLPHRLLH